MGGRWREGGREGERREREKIKQGIVSYTVISD